MKIILKTIISVVTVLIFISAQLQGQNLDDAVRYSQLSAGGSARVMGVGGAFGAMGGDFGVSGANVSGLADYRSKELMFTLSHNKVGTKTFNNGTQVGDNNDGKETILENLAFISHNKPYYSENLLTSNFAVGLQQYSNYNQVISYDTRSRGSLVGTLANLANLDDYNAFDVELADLAGAIFYDSEFETYVHDFSSEIQDANGNVIGLSNVITDEVPKEQIIERSGRVNELLIAWAGRFRQGLNLGVGIGIPFVNYQEDKFYAEDDSEDLFPVFTQLNFNESFSTSGVGINLKLGLGYTVAKRIRLGVGWQSPSYMSLRDNFNNSLAYDCTLCDETASVVFESPEGEFRYRLRTPMKTTLSAGYLLNKEKLKGFLNVDFQMVNYTQNKFDFTLGEDENDPGLISDESFENGIIDIELRSAYNWAIGAELVYQKWRVRSGVNLQGAPFFLDAGQYDKTYAVGLGYRLNRIFFDFAYQYRQSEEGYSPYRTAGGDPALPLVSDNQIHKLALTMGFKL